MEWLLDTSERGNERDRNGRSDGKVPKFRQPAEADA